MLELLSRALVQRNSSFSLTLFSEIVRWYSPLEALEATRRRRRRRGPSRRAELRGVCLATDFSAPGLLGFQRRWRVPVHPIRPVFAWSPETLQRRIQPLSRPAFRCQDSRFASPTSLSSSPHFFFTFSSSSSFLQDVRSLCSPHLRPWPPVLGSPAVCCGFPRSQPKEDTVGYLV